MTAESPGFSRGEYVKTYIPDNAICSYSGFQQSLPGCLAIGWLGEKHPHNKDGELFPGFMEALKIILKDQKTNLKLSFMGRHKCELCERVIKGKFDHYGHIPTETWTEKENDNLLVKGEEENFGAPELLLHYIADQGEVPPENFQKEVLKIAKKIENGTYEPIDPEKEHDKQLKNSI